MNGLTAVDRAILAEAKRIKERLTESASVTMSFLDDDAWELYYRMDDEEDYQFVYRGAVEFLEGGKSVDGPTRGLRRDDIYIMVPYEYVHKNLPRDNEETVKTFVEGEHRLVFSHPVDITKAETVDHLSLWKGVGYVEIEYSLVDVGDRGSRYSTKNVVWEGVMAVPFELYFWES